MEQLTQQEQQVLTHWSMFGSDGYPIRKSGRQWWVDGMYQSGSCPIPFGTKRAAVAQWEAFIDILIAKKAGRL